jgi:putative DNA primase/helicase
MDVIAKHAAPYMKVEVDDLDRDPMKLNVRNGTIAFEKSEGEWAVRFYEHNPDDLITKVADVDYDPAADCDAYDAAFALVQPDPAVRAFLHRLIGYACTGDVSEQKVFFFYGGGRNGKSTFMETWARCLGGYASTIPIERFLHVGQSGDAAKPSPDLARLRAVRMLRTSEPERGSKLAESTIKLITSGEPMLVRELNRPFFHLHPQFKLFISGNYMPAIRGTDDGIWRRLILVPWPVKITDEQCDPHLVEKLEREASGILNRMIAGTLDWLRNGLSIPPAISKETDEFRQASDLLGRFLTECVRSSASSRVQATELYSVFVAWAKASGDTVWTQPGFGRAMTSRHYKRTKSGTIHWLDIELVKTTGDFQDQAEERAEDSPGSDDVPF